MKRYLELNRARALHDRPTRVPSLIWPSFNEVYYTKLLERNALVQKETEIPIVPCIHKTWLRTINGYEKQNPLGTFFACPSLDPTCSVHHIELITVLGRT